MTAAVFLLVLIAAWVHFHVAEVGWLLYGNVTIYVAAFTATLASAVTAAAISGQRRAIVAAGVLVLNYAGSHWAWTTADPILAQASVDIVTAAYFILIGRRRWEIGIGMLHIAMVLVGALTFFGLIPSAGDRRPVYIDWSHPDLIALLGHAVNVTLGLGSGDAGRRIKRWMDSLGHYPRHRHWAHLVRRPEVAQSRAREDRRLGEIE